MKYIGFKNSEYERLDIYKNGSQGIIVEITDSLGEVSIYEFFDLDDALQLADELRDMIIEIQNPE